MSTENMNSLNTILGKRDRQENPKTRRKQKERHAQGSSSLEAACDTCRAKKIRCGREQPRCSYCQRNDLTCETTDRGRKVNQGDKVLNELKDLRARFDNMSNHFVQLSMAVKGLTSVPRIPITPPELRPESSHSDPMTHFEYPDVIDSASVFSLDSDVQDFTYTEDQQKELRGSNSLMSVVKNAQKALSGRLAMSYLGMKYNDISMKEFVDYKDEAVQRLEEVVTSNDSESIPPNGQRLSLPPQALLRDFMKPYFDHLNPVLPFLHEGVFLEGIAQIYDGATTEVDSAWMLCMNNLILLSLNTRAKTGNAIQNAIDAGLTDIQDMLLKNAKRGIAKIDELSEPGLINVQALISMCILSQENFQLELADTFLQRACQVAKDMALHRQANDLAGQSSSQAQERMTLFWVLYVIDKNMSLTTGSPLCLPYIDCDVPFPEEESGSSLNHHFLARIKLAHIQEQIYAVLYSSNGRIWTDAERELVVLQLIQSLQRWYETHEPLINPGHFSSSNAGTLLDDELAFCFFNSRTLITRQVRNQISRRQCLEQSKDSIKILKKLRLARKSDPGKSVAHRPFQSFPFPLFFDIFVNLIWYPMNGAVDEDLAVLQCVVEIIQDISSPENETGYYSKASVIVSTLTDVVSNLFKRVNGGLYLDSHTMSPTDPSGRPSNPTSTSPTKLPGATRPSRSHRHQPLSPRPESRRSDRYCTGAQHPSGWKRLDTDTPPLMTPLGFPDEESMNVPFAPPGMISGADDWLNDEMSSALINADAPEFCNMETVWIY